ERVSAQFPQAFVGPAEGLLVDAYGEAPLHALLHANTEESLECASLLIRRFPLLLLNVQAGLVGYK
ncbi:MAG: hypothetical protein SGPRY_011957, partial [Prymnesium sp.]